MSRRSRRSLIEFLIGMALMVRAQSLSAACCPGDLDGNGIVQSADTFQFAGILLGVAGTPDQLCATDVNADGVRNGRDIQAFVTKVIAVDVCPAACCMGAGVCQSLTPNQCAVAGGCTQGIGTTCAPNPCACQAGRCDINGLCSDGCELLVNSNPGCNSNQFLGSFRGDLGADMLIVNGATERWYRIQVTEASSSLQYLSASIRLQSNPQSNFDLHLYCSSCSGGAVAVSSAGTGLLDQFDLRWEDDWFEDDSQSVFVEVRWVSGGCDGFNLTIAANLAATNLICDP